jgi:type I restriction enzyme S subunit
VTQGWTHAPLIEFAELVSTGPFGSMLHKSDYVSDGVPLINPTNIVDGLILPDDEKQVGPEALARLQSYVLKEGDVIVGRRGEIGRCAVVKAEQAGWVCGTGCFFIRPRAITDAHFLAHLLRSPEYRAQLEQASTGATMKNMSNTTLAQLQIALPSPHEQRRIVTILDEAFEGIATAKAHAEQNLRNVRALFECYLSRALARGGRGWREISLADATGGVCTGPFGSLLHKSEYVENGIPLINPAHITDVGFAPDLRKSVSASTAQRLSSYLLRQGDIVIGRRGDMGRCAVVTAAEEGWLCGTGSFIIRSSSHCDARFLVRLLRSDDCKKRLEKIAGGAVMPNLSNSDLSDFVILLPPIDVQREILGDVDAMAQEVERLEFIGRKKISALTELQQSLLHQAFTGQF